MARVSIFGFFDSRTTKASACAVSLEPFEAMRTRSFGDSVVRMSARDEEEEEVVGWF